MSAFNYSKDVGGGKPKLITLLTSGTGTYIPTENNARCIVRRQGAGAGGRTAVNSGGGGGGAGAMVESMEVIPIAGFTYSIGAGGAADTSGSPTRFGNVIAAGGEVGISTVFYGGVGGFIATGDTSVQLGGVPGYSGGAGGTGAGASPGGKGFAPGFSTGVGGGNGQSAGGTGANGGSGGGDSFFGRGGNGASAGAVGGAPSGYGAGGGGGGGTNFAGATGGGGCIEILDFGA